MFEPNIQGRILYGKNVFLPAHPGGGEKRKGKLRFGPAWEGVKHELSRVAFLPRSPAIIRGCVASGRKSRSRRRLEGGVSANASSGRGTKEERFRGLGSVRMRRGSIREDAGDSFLGRGGGGSRRRGGRSQDRRKGEEEKGGGGGPALRFASVLTTNFSELG